MLITGPHRVRICAVHRPALDLRHNYQLSLKAQNSNGPRH
jgi:hypothetical protein